MDGLIKIVQWLWETLQNHILFFVIVKEFEGGVLLRLGKYKYDLKKGFNWKWPLVDETMTTPIRLETMNLGSITLTTADDVTCTIGVVIEYEIIDVKIYLVEINGTYTNLHDICRGIAVDVLTDTNWIDCNKKPTLTKIKNKMIPSCEAMGVKLTRVLYGNIVKSRSFALFNTTNKSDN